jgi:hypothetical protein
MDVIVYTDDATVQATEIAEALQDNDYFVASVKVYVRGSDSLQDEWYL